MNTSGIRRDPRILYLSSVKSSCGVDCNDINGIDAGTCVRESIPVEHSYSSRTGTSIRCLPSFIIAGTMKSGTGELMRWLDRHPFLKVGKGKLLEKDKVFETNEVHYFGEAYLKSTCKWLSYLHFFPDFGLVDDSLESSIKNIYTFEKSPDYIRSEEKLKQMKTLLPNIRLIIILRNPVTRAISSFDHNCRHGRYIRLLIDVEHNIIDEKTNSKKHILLKKIQ